MALDELKNAIGSYSARLVSCTPKDDQQRFKTYSLKGDVSVVKPKGSRSLEPPEETKGKAPPAAAAGGSRGAAMAMERGPDTMGR